MAVSSGARRLAPGQVLVVAPVAALVLGLLALVGFALLSHDSAGAGSGVNRIGRSVEVKARPAPDVALTGFDGQPIRLADLRGQVVVVNFWASWCAPCREEAPVLAKASQAYRSRGVAFVGVATWDRDQDSRAFLREFGLTYPNGPDKTGESAIAFGVAGVPETFFVDREGQVVRRWIGPLGEAGLSAVLEELLR